MIGDLAAEGLGVVVVSSYLPEVLGLADRVIVMREGGVAGELPAVGTTEEDVRPRCLRDRLQPGVRPLVGMPVTAVLVAVYAIAGLLAAVGGVLFASRLNAGIPTAGTGYELNAIAACVIGGASLFGA